MRRDNPQVESTPIAFTVLDEIRKQLNDFTPRHRAFAEFVLQVIEGSGSFLGSRHRA